MNDIVEFILRIKDYASGPLDAIRGRAGGTRRALDDVADSGRKAEAGFTRTGKSISHLERNIRRLNEMRRLLPPDSEHQLGRINRLLKSTNAELTRMKAVGVDPTPGARAPGSNRWAGRLRSILPGRLGGIAGAALLNPVTAAVTAGGAIAGYALRQGARAEYERTRFTNEYGAGGGRFFDSLRAQKSSLGDGVLEYGRTLADAGVELHQVDGYLRRLGDVANGSDEKMSGLVGTFAEMRKTGILTRESLDKLGRYGFQPLGQIYRRSGDDLDTLMRRLEEGKITIGEVEQALKDATGEGGKFFGNLDRLDDSSLTRWKNFANAWSTSWSNAVENVLSALNLGGSKEAGPTQWDTSRLLSRIGAPTPNPLMTWFEGIFGSESYVQSMTNPARSKHDHPTLEELTTPPPEKDDSSMADRIHAVSGGGVRNVTINITKLIETINNTWAAGQTRDASIDLERRVTESLVRVLASAAGR